MSVFKGLEKYGFEKEKDMDIYSDSENLTLEHKKIVERDALYDKNYICPVCKDKFKDKAVKSSRQRILKIEYDLRPIYDYFEMYKYDVVICPHCGYAALNSTFTKITAVQASLVAQKIGSRYKSRGFPEVYDYETAIIRYKLALLNGVVKNAASIEKAFLCLKLKWLFTVKIEEAKEEKDVKLEDYKKQHDEFLDQALKGFIDAYLKADFNSFGFDESKVMYIIGELYSQQDNIKEAYQWLTKVVGQNGINYRLKEKAKDRRSELKKQYEALKRK